MFPGCFIIAVPMPAIIIPVGMNEYFRCLLLLVTCRYVSTKTISRDAKSNCRLFIPGRRDNGVRSNMNDGVNDAFRKNIKINFIVRNDAKNI